MNIYHVYTENNAASWDDTDELVIVANDEDEARQIAYNAAWQSDSGQCSRESVNFLNKTTTHCKLIGFINDENEKSRIIVQSNIPG